MFKVLDEPLPEINEFEIRVTVTRRFNVYLPLEFIGRRCKMAFDAKNGKLELLLDTETGILISSMGPIAKRAKVVFSSGYFNFTLFRSEKIIATAYLERSLEGDVIRAEGIFLTPKLVKEKPLKNISNSYEEDIKSIEQSITTLNKLSDTYPLKFEILDGKICGSMYRQWGKSDAG